MIRIFNVDGNQDGSRIPRLPDAADGTENPNADSYRDLESSVRGQPAGSGQAGGSEPGPEDASVLDNPRDNAFTGVLIGALVGLAVWVLVLLLLLQIL